MTKTQVVDSIRDFARTHSTAPYGVAEGKRTAKSGRRADVLTFGLARTLDCSVDVFGPHFIRLKHTRGYGDVELFTSVDTLMERLREIFCID